CCAATRHLQVSGHAVHSLLWRLSRPVPGQQRDGVPVTANRIPRPQGDPVKARSGRVRDRLHPAGRQHAGHDPRGHGL
ncbi:hypothetical protein EC988_009477, partial [Linderina pennispora]